MPGTIGVICNDTRRFNRFLISMTDMIRYLPADVQVIYADTSDRSKGRNEIVKSFLKTDGEWLVFIDDDHTFEPDFIPRLLRHDEPIVASLYLQRQPPYSPVAYSHREGNKYFPINLNDYKGDELVQVLAAGTGGMLIRRKVFDAMGVFFDPESFFWNGTSSEDLNFCVQANDLGIPVFVDLSVRMGHLIVSSVEPVFEDEWACRFDFTNSFALDVSLDEF